MASRTRSREGNKNSRTRQRVEGSTRPGSIPLRPELVEFMSARCLSRYGRCSKAVRADVREANAWQLLAAQQVPRPTPRTARDALELDAISRVRSHVRRRLLADALENTSTPRLNPNHFEDFSFFVRLRQDDVVIWEGDLLHQRGSDDGFLHLPLAEVWATIKQSGSCAELTTWLAQTGTLLEQDQAVLGRLSITLVAIRKSDEAMVSLGHFSLSDQVFGTGTPDQSFRYNSSPHVPLFASPGHQFRADLWLGTLHGTTGGGTLNYLDLEITHSVTRETTHSGELSTHSMQYLLTYLAGVQPFERAAALRTIQSWGSIDSDSEPDSD